MTLRPPLLLLAALAALTPLPATGQDGAWDGPTVLELVERARENRGRAVDDPTFRSYQADARGWIFFSLDRPDEEVRTPVKTTQVALEVYWRAPGDTKQRIVGMREAEDLPTSIRYHLDHLTVVQDDFDDRIRLGDGDEVESVVHPMAPGSGLIYQFRLADSLALDFPGREEPLRVHRVEVRPRDLDVPGLVGSVFLERSTAAIVRMSFTFTPSSYVDPHLDYIRISLENALWLGRYWLPRRQEIEIRRELPQIDFVAGSVIGARFDIRDYRFNQDLPDELFRSRAVSAAPQAEREAFPFEVPLSAGRVVEGLGEPVSLEQLRQEARQLATGRVLSGLGGLRFRVGAISDVARYGRAEGLRLGGGITLRPRGGIRVHTNLGWAFGRDALSGSLEVTRDPTAATGAALELDALRDLGPLPGAPGLLNSFAALGGQDYLDPYFVTGARLFHGEVLPGGARIEAVLRYERHESGALVVRDSEGHRPVRPVEEGTLEAVDLALELPDVPRGVTARLDTRLARMEGRAYTVVRGGLDWVREAAGTGFDVGIEGQAGWAGDEAPAQEHFLLGGRATLPGHPYRMMVGDRYWLLTARLGHPIRHPWLGAHAFATVGRAWMGGDREVPEGWSGRGDRRSRASVGAGVDLLWEVIRLDLARGLGSGGDWELIFGVHHRFQAWL